MNGPLAALSARATSSARTGHQRLIAASGATSALALFAYLFAKAGSVRRLVVRLAILGVRSTTLVAFLILARNTPSALVHAKRNFSLRRALWYIISTWSVAEALFLVYILEYKRRLNSQTTRRWKAVTTHSTEEKRLKSLERYLRSLTQVAQSGATNVQDQQKQRTGPELNGTSRLKRSLCPPTSPKSIPRKVFSADHDAWSVNKIRSFSSSNSLFGLAQKHEASVDDLLKLWEGNENITDQDLQRLRWLELASFFWGPGRGDAEDVASWLQRGNVEEWVAHYWFRGATPEDLELNRGERQELKKLVDVVLENANLTDLPGGRNPQVTCFRIFTDPLPVMHRPLAIYGMTSLLCPLLTLQVMKQLGFHRERVGGLAYWKRDPRKDVDPETDINGQTPLVFVHGLGVGLVPYYLFIYRLSRRHSGDLYVPEFPCLAMAPWESVPSAREVVAQLQDMLAANGHTAAHFAGHSFGSVIIGWLIKMSPSSVIYTTLMEPAQFLMMKSECLCKVLYQEPETCYEMAIRYFGFRELFTVNLLCRNFFWEQSTMWPEEVRVPALIELAGADHIVQSLFVRRLLEHERTARKQRKKGRRPSIVQTGSSVDVREPSTPQANDPQVLDIYWCDDFLHGEILLRPRAQDRLFSKMRQMRLQTESAK